MNRQERRMLQKKFRLEPVEHGHLDKGGDPNVLVPLLTVVDIVRETGMDEPEEWLRQELASGRLVAQALEPNEDGISEIVVSTESLAAWFARKH